MKIIHLSDLHLGKRVNEISMLEEQEYILIKIENIIGEEKPDCILIAGDVYDKPIPSAEAVQLFDTFLSRLSDMKQQVFVISGNHDSPERIAFGSRLMERSGIHMSPVYNGHVEPFSLSDEYGAVNIYMLPFIKPANVRRFYTDKEINTYTEAVKAAIDGMKINTDERNILITHQFVTGAYTSDSEEISVGGSDNVDAIVFEKFDYVALGHIHGPQNIGVEHIRYCGTPLKYSFSEANHKKSVTVAEIHEKGNTSVRTVSLIPRHEMCRIRGTFAELSRSDYKDEKIKSDDFLQITLTDEEDIPDAVGKLRLIYPNIMKLDYDNARTRLNMLIDGIDDSENKTPVELFTEFYEKQNNKPMSEQQLCFSKKLIEEIWEGEV